MEHTQQDIELCRKVHAALVKRANEHGMDPVEWAESLGPDFFDMQVADECEAVGLDLDVFNSWSADPDAQTEFEENMGANQPGTHNGQHTPGPWEASEGSYGTLGGKMERRIFIRTTFHAQGKITNGPEATLATIEPDAIGNSAFNIGGEPFEHRVTAAEAEANARVMAASPKMLKALVQAEALIAAHWTGNTLDAVREAIAEATGSK